MTEDTAKEIAKYLELRAHVDRKYDLRDHLADNKEWLIAQLVAFVSER
jgi:hypothetical protein